MIAKPQCNSKQELNGWPDVEFRCCEKPLKKKKFRQNLDENPRPYCELTKKVRAYFEG